jgi:hypothetical protein
MQARVGSWVNGNVPGHWLRVERPISARAW